MLTVLPAAKGLRPAQVDVLRVLAEMGLAEDGELVLCKGGDSVKVSEKGCWCSVRKVRRLETCVGRFI